MSLRTRPPDYVSAMTIAEQLLTEMPWLSVGDVLFDLELEKYHHKSARELVATLKQLLHGEPVVDKHGTELKLRNAADRAAFRQAVASNSVARSLRHSAGIDVLWLIDQIIEGRASVGAFERLLA
jgi:hypothetical protein